MTAVLVAGAAWLAAISTGTGVLLYIRHTIGDHQ